MPSNDSSLSVLVIDIGGTHVKLALGDEHLKASFESSPDMTPTAMLQRVQHETREWPYSVIAIGYPGQVGAEGPLAEPGNLGAGWVGFDFSEAFGKPVRIINDAVLQGLGAYHGGRMLFLGFGTGVGSALITDRLATALDLGELPYQDDTLMHHLGRDAYAALGEVRWRHIAQRVIPALRRAFLADYVVIGGGHAACVGTLPPHTECGTNDDAIEGGRRLWREAVDPHRRPQPYWRVVG